MKINSGKEEVQFGFDVHAPGGYVFEIQQEGITFGKAEDTEKFTIMIPTRSIDVYKLKTCDPGETESVGRQINCFITLITKEGKVNTSGENQLAGILTICGLASHFETKFRDDIPFTHKPFLEEVSMRLPGKRFAGQVEHRKWNDQTNANFKNMEMLPSVRNKMAETTVSSPSSNANQASSDQSDW